MFVTRNVARKYLAPMGARHLLMEGEGGGSGGGGGGGPQIPKELEGVVQTMIAQAVEAQVVGLKNKNTELLNDLRTTKDTLKKFDGMDPEVINQIVKRFGDDNDQKLIKEGKIDELLAQRTERMAKDWQKKVDAEVEARKKLENKSNKLASRATADAIRGAALKAGAMPEAIDDIVLRAQAQGWTVNDDGDVVATKDGTTVFGKDAKTPLTPIEWAEDLRDKASHLWPKPQGSGANGNTGFNNGKVVIDPSMSAEARLTAARQQNQARH